MHPATAKLRDSANGVRDFNFWQFDGPRGSFAD
jgi:hypothetical protein